MFWLLQGGLGHMFYISQVVSESYIWEVYAIFPLCVDRGICGYAILARLSF